MVKGGNRNIAIRRCHECSELPNTNVIIVLANVWDSIVLNLDLANWLSGHIFSSARHKL